MKKPNKPKMTTPYSGLVEFPFWWLESGNEKRSGVVRDGAAISQTLGEEMKIMEKRHILIGGVALIKGRLRNDGMAMVRVCDSLEPSMVSWLSDAPFDTISLIVRYGTDTTDEVDIGRINRRHSELPVAVQVALSELQAVQSDEASLDSVFRHHALRALRGIGSRYSLGALPEST